MRSNARQRIPEPLLSQLHAARICRMLLPRSVDGDEVQPWVYLRAIEELSRRDGSVGWNVFVANSAALIAPFLPPRSMHAIFDDPRAVVAWGPPNESKAHAVPGGYRITGQWNFASGCRQATWMGAHGRVMEPDGSLRLNEAGRPTVRTLLFPVAQATLIDDSWKVIGMRGTDVGCLSARRCVRARGLQQHARGSDAAARAWPALRLPDAGSLCGRGGRCRHGHRARHARHVQGTRHPQDAAQSRAARGQRGRAVERGADGGAAGCRSRLSGGDAVRASGRPTTAG